MKRITIEERCPACKGTGLYVGICERDGAAVVCRKCDGTGLFIFEHSYEDFVAREDRDNVTHVYGINPGIVADAGVIVPGGVPYEVWKTDPQAPHRSGKEMRQHVCPAWWYQSADYSKKPNWKKCEFGMFSQCSHFDDRAACWREWDLEFNGKKDKIKCVLLPVRGACERLASRRQGDVEAAQSTPDERGTVAEDHRGGKAT